MQVPPLPPCIRDMMAKDQEGPPTIACPVIASNPTFICITAKSPSATAQFVLPEICTIEQFKEELSKHFGCETGQLVLVFFGRILKDQDTFRQCGVGDGMTVHLVIRPLKREQESPPPLPAYVPRTATCAPPPCGSSLPSPTFSPGAEGLWTPLEMNPSSAEWQLVPTSEMIVQKVRQLILANPEVQQLAQQVPAISHILNNMDIMRVILDKMREIVGLARSPDTTQDLKSPDQPSVNLQSSIPGGDNPLRQLNGDVQEPGLSMAQDLFATPSPYSTLARQPCLEHAGLRGQGPHMESQERMGALPLSLSSTSIGTSSSRSDEGSSFGGPANPLECSSYLPHPAPGARAGMFSAGGVQAPDSAEIPMLIMNLCNAYTKRMMFSLMQNALLASGGAQAAQQEQVQQEVLHFFQQMQSPEMVAAMSSPKATQAWVQMEQGLQTLVAEAPVLVPWFMLRLRGLGCSAGVIPWPQDSPCPEPAASE